VISEDLLAIMQALRGDMFEMLRRQGTISDPSFILILIVFLGGLESTYIGLPKLSPSGSGDHPISMSDSNSSNQLQTPTTERNRSARFKHKTLGLPISMSESDLSGGELSARYDTDDDSCNSRISSNNSMSRYDSESPLHPLLLQDFKVLIMHCIRYKI
jgi:hypothetical protein